MGVNKLQRFKIHMRYKGGIVGEGGGGDNSQKLRTSLTMVISPVICYELRKERYKTKGGDEADSVTLRGPATPATSWFPTGLLDNRRL